MAALLGNTGGTTLEGMAVKKRTIALDADVAREVEREAKLAGLSVSAWLTEAARKHLKWVDAMRATEEAFEMMGLEWGPEAQARGEAILAKHGIIPKRRKHPAKNKARRRGEADRNHSSFASCAAARSRTSTRPMRVASAPSLRVRRECARASSTSWSSKAPCDAATSCGRPIPTT